MKQEEAAGLFLLGDFVVGLALATYSALWGPLPPRFVQRDFGYFLLMAAMPLGMALLASSLLRVGMLWAGSRAIRDGPWLPLLLGAAHLPMLSLLQPLATLMARSDQGVLFMVAWVTWPVLIVRWLTRKICERCRLGLGPILFNE